MPTWTMDESTAVNHVLKRIPTNATVLKLAEIPREPWRFHTFGGEHGLSSGVVPDGVLPEATYALDASVAEPAVVVGVMYIIPQI